MKQIKNPRLLKWLSRIAAIAALVYLYSKLSNTFSIDTIKMVFADFSVRDQGLMVPLCLLSVVNWCLEGHKWKYVLKGQISYARAMQQSLALHSISYVIPLKLTDYPIVQKLLPEHAHKDLWMRRFLLSYSQQIATISMGFIASMFFVPDFLPGPKYIYPFFILVFLLSYLAPSILPKQFNQLKAKWGFEEQIPLKDKFGLIVLALLRYASFSIQLLWLFQLMGFTPFSTESYFLLSWYYLISSFAPRFLLSDLLIKESVGLALLANNPEQTVLVSTAIFLLWLLNSVLPLIVGLFFSRKLSLI